MLKFKLNDSVKFYLSVWQSINLLIQSEAKEKLISKFFFVLELKEFFSKTNLLFMDLMINEISGKYLGTEIKGKWWKRYRRNKMFARGDGKFFADDKIIYFLRLLTREPIYINIEDITGFSVGKWLMGYPVLKVNWQKDGLCSAPDFSYAKLNRISGAL
ncbi:MAG: hypothetical protein KGZ85_00620 [Ignavibacterium sp.]|nr:hypothetical protein [Ignavibacterium sp.]